MLLSPSASIIKEGQIKKRRLLPLVGGRTNHAFSRKVQGWFEEKFLEELPLWEGDGGGLVW